jgi:tyrosyl-tRNA synthetase
MILQAYDFPGAKPPLRLPRADGRVGPVGNIVNGIDLTRRVDGPRSSGLTSHLLTTSDGRKMGKSQGGAVWLNGDMLSPTSSGSSGGIRRTRTWGGS